MRINLSQRRKVRKGEETNSAILCVSARKMKKMKMKLTDF